MPPDVIEGIAALLGMVSIGTMILIGMRIRYAHLQRVRGGGAGKADVDRLKDAVDNLSDEVRLMREEILAINDRVEFTERLLERPKKTAEADPS